jgi:hypothetical protein
MARRLSQLGVAVMAASVLGAAPLHAQAVEVVPFGGFRFGSVLVDANTARPLEVDGAPAVGVTVDVPLSNGMQVEAAFSRQRATIFAPGDALTPSLQSHVTVDHYQAGGLQEYDVANRARPFLTGVLGLTRYASGGNNEIRFTAGGGGGVKLFPVPHVGVRLDGKVFATFLDAHGTALACGGRGCLIALHVNVAWQAEFTAGLLVKLR